MSRPEFTLRARYVFPVDGPPIRGGSVRVAGERITYVGEADRQPDLDLDSAAIVPGFVNAHTHLELSNIRARQIAAENFVNWLRHVIDARRGQRGADLSHAVQRGIDASLASGTTLVGDITTGGASWRLLARSPLRAAVFCELLGLSPTRARETASTARHWLELLGASRETTTPAAASAERSLSTYSLSDGSTIDPLPPPSGGRSRRWLCPTLSPHAPYSTHPALYQWAAAWGRQAGFPICTHLAETREELQLLASRDGPLRGFLVSIGAWDDAWQPAGRSPASYVESPGTREANWLIAHGNYLTDAEIVALGSASSTDGCRRAVVYCPRTHAYFGHPPHPYAKMLAAGLVVCLGTDSLASTPTLSILDELRFLHRRDQSLTGHALLRMATLAGAWALGQDDCCGSLAAGKLADLAVVGLPDRDESDPHRLLVDSNEPVLKTMIGGRFVFQLRGANSSK